MADDKVTESRSVEPVQVAVIGTRDGSKLVTGTEAVTKSIHEPNIVVNVVTPLFAIFVRFANGFFTTLVALVGAAMLSNVIPATDFFHLVLKCATLSVAGAGLGALKDLVTIFGRLEQKYPLLTGSV